MVAAILIVFNVQWWEARQQERLTTTEHAGASLVTRSLLRDGDNVRLVSPPTLTWWSTSLSSGTYLATLSVHDGKVRYVIDGKPVSRDKFYHWLDQYLLRQANHTPENWR